MKQFLSVKDAGDPGMLTAAALAMKSDPRGFRSGKGRTLGLIFMNPSFRTRLSTQKAAVNLGMDVIVLNITQEGWKLEFGDGAVMNGDTVEHVKDAAAIMGIYCDIVGIRCFPGLESRDLDYSEHVLNSFVKHCKCPVVSLESATRHPLQSFADLITIRESWQSERKPKVVLMWAPHIKALPQAVPNSFAEWMGNAGVDLTIAHPEGYELCGDFTANAIVTHNREEALRDADFVYVKNWSSYADYGKMPEVNDDWLLTPEKMAATANAKIMHCLPVRRNVELTDELLDSPRSLVLQQAENRIYAAQAVLDAILTNLEAQTDETAAAFTEDWGQRNG
jgi:N-succinyl-L-ornithine transcarbamylase